MHKIKKIMTLHIFNPDHDIALVSNLENFTPPHAARQLRRDLGLLPAVWASEESCVLVDDEAVANLLWRSMSRKLGDKRKPRIVTRDSLAKEAVDRIEPWGWDLALRSRLLRYGVGEHLLPTRERINEIRLLSHRRSSCRLLPLLRTEGTVGEARECNSLAEVSELMNQWGKVVAKAPWSSSGRGIRFLSGTLTLQEEGWLRNVLSQQGSVMIEPYYRKIKDFGMEFSCDALGRVTYQGLSLFSTQNGAYQGNVLATESAKRSMMESFLPLDLLDKMKCRICEEAQTLLAGRYEGPFGVDMMVVGGNGEFLLHPCVEINLRRTMGHVAIALSKAMNPDEDDERQGVMRIHYSENRYRLRIASL